MIHDETDPLGKAILDYLENGHTTDIEVESSITEIEVIPVPYLLRSWQDMPEKEQYVLSEASGRILDVGAGSGAHALALQQQGKTVVALDWSVACCVAMKQQGIKNVVQADFFQYNPEETFDTILCMMNGIGIAGTLEYLPDFFKKCKSLLRPGGILIAESADILYMFEEEDGSCSIDLNGSYYGELQYKMHYKQYSSNWFPWLYVSKDLALDVATDEGFSLLKVKDGADRDYFLFLTSE